MGKERNRKTTDSPSPSKITENDIEIFRKNINENVNNKYTRANKEMQNSLYEYAKENIEKEGRDYQYKFMNHVYEEDDTKEFIRILSKSTRDDFKNVKLLLMPCLYFDNPYNGYSPWGFVLKFGTEYEIKTTFTVLFQKIDMIKNDNLLSYAFLAIDPLTGSDNWISCLIKNKYIDLLKTMCEALDGKFAKNLINTNFETMMGISLFSMIFMSDLNISQKKMVLDIFKTGNTKKHKDHPFVMNIEMFSMMSKDEDLRLALSLPSYCNIKFPIECYEDSEVDKIIEDYIETFKFLNKGQKDIEYKKSNYITEGFNTQFKHRNKPVDKNFMIKSITKYHGENSAVMKIYKKVCNDKSKKKLYYLVREINNIKKRGLLDDEKTNPIEKRVKAFINKNANNNISKKEIVKSE